MFITKLIKFFFIFKFYIKPNGLIKPNSLQLKSTLIQFEVLHHVRSYQLITTIKFTLNAKKYSTVKIITKS